MKTALIPAGCVLLAILGGCVRTSPPEVRKFRPPAKRVLKEIVVAETTSSGPPRPAERKPEPEPVKAPVAASRPAPRVEVKEAPKPEPAKAPTIVGSWKMIEMSQNGQKAPMPEGMEMSWNFEEGGSFTMSMSAPNMPAQPAQQGTYTISGDQITITMRGDAKTGSFLLEGDRLTMEIDRAKVVMQRM